MSTAITAASPYFTTKELAERIRKSPGAVRQMRHRGLGPRGTRVGNVVLYRLDHIEAWEAARAEADEVGQRATT